MMSSTSTTEPVDFTDACARKVFSLLQEEQTPDLNLRVYINGGGCSGFQYGFMFDAEIREDDIIVSKVILPEEDEGGSGGTVQLLIDAMSFQYLEGAQIDYREDVAGSQFVIRNPNAKTTCGCGSSFSVD